MQGKISYFVLHTCIGKNKADWKNGRVIKNCNSLKKGLILESLVISDRLRCFNIINNNHGNTVPTTWNWSSGTAAEYCSQIWYLNYS